MSQGQIWKVQFYDSKNKKYVSIKHLISIWRNLKKTAHALLNYAGSYKWYAWLENVYQLHNLLCKMSAKLQLPSVSLCDSRWNQKSSKITRDKACFCVNQDASTHQCELSWHGGIWMRALVTSSRWSWENGGQSLWEESCDAQWRAVTHLSSSFVFAAT